MFAIRIDHDGESEYWGPYSTPEDILGADRPRMVTSREYLALPEGTRLLAVADPPSS